MTNKERYLAALRCEETDRVPIVIRGVNPLFNNAGWPPANHPSFQPLIDMVAEKTEWVYRWHPPGEDLLSSHPDAQIKTMTRDSEQDGFKEKVKTYVTPLGDLESIEYINLEGKPGLTKKYLIESDEDLEKFLSISYEFTQPETSEFFKLKKKMGDNGVLVANIGLDPIGHVTNRLGLENLAIWSISNREGLFRLLDEFTRRAELFIKALLEDSVGPVFSTLGMEQATPPMLRVSDFDELVTPYDERLWSVIRNAGGLLHVHCHGHLKQIAKKFITMGANCLHPVEAPPMGNLELHEAKRIFKGKICIEGNIQLDEIYRESEEYIRESVREAIKDAAPGGGFVLCPTASPIPPKLEDKVLKNYLAFIEAGIENGEMI
jgi:uroporphyrinogen-III decarboxylase